MADARSTPRRAGRGFVRCLAAGVVMAGLATVTASVAASAASAQVRPLPVPPEARSGASSWPYPDHDPSNSRLATGSPITAKNIARVTTAWKVSASGGLPTSPIVVGHNVFVEDQVGEVFDIDLDSGRVIWKSPSNGYSVGPEGVAVGWGKVFGVTPTSLFALDEKTGDQLWSTRLTRTATDGIDVQPQVVGREVIASTVPVSIKGIYTGGDRGFIDAVDESSGKLLWGFDTVASPHLVGESVGELGRRLVVPAVVLAAHRLALRGRGQPGAVRRHAAIPQREQPARGRTSTPTPPSRSRSPPESWSGTTRPPPRPLRPGLRAHDGGPGPRRSGTSGHDGRRGNRQGRCRDRDEPADGPATLAHAGRDPQEQQSHALSGPTEILPGTFGGVLTPPASAHGNGVRGDPERAGHAVPRPDRVLRREDRHHAGRGRGDRRSERTHLWDTRVPGDPTGGVTLVNNLVLTATLQGVVLGLSMSTGRILWRLRHPAESTGGCRWSAGRSSCRSASPSRRRSGRCASRRT